MNAARITGIVLIVLGLAGFFTGGFSFTKDTTAAKVGPIQLTVKEKESVNIPQWAGISPVGAAGPASPAPGAVPLRGEQATRSELGRG
jgi:hypothetical protein